MKLKLPRPSKLWDRIVTRAFVPQMKRIAAQAAQKQLADFDYNELAQNICYSRLGEDIDHEALGSALMHSQSLTDLLDMDDLASIIATNIDASDIASHIDVAEVGSNMEMSSVVEEMQVSAEDLAPHMEVDSGAITEAVTEYIVQNLSISIDR